MDEQLAAFVNASFSTSRRRLGHLPLVTASTASRYTSEGSCPMSAGLDAYDPSDFTIALWTRGKPHMLQFVESFDGVSAHAGGAFANYCFEMTTPEVIWARDHGSAAPGITFADLRPTSGTNVRDDEWVLRAVSFNRSHLCVFLNGEMVCRYLPNFACPRVQSLYMAPLTSAEAYLHTMLLSPVRTYTPALSEVALTQLYYTELPVYNAHIVGPRRTNLQQDEPRRLELAQFPGRTYSIVPPLTYQVRRDSKACTGFSQSTVNAFEQIRAERCRGYQCSLASAAPVVQCLSDQPSGNASFFGRSSNLYQDGQVYSEFLHTLCVVWNSTRTP
jgi:hypothetical protein